MALQAGLSSDKNIQRLYDRISVEDFEKLCPIYRQALGDLAAKLNILNTDEEKLLALTKFSEKYLMLPNYASQKIRLQKIVGSSMIAAKTPIKHLYSVPFHDTIKPMGPWTTRQLLVGLNCNEKHIAWKYFAENSANLFNVRRSMKDIQRALTFPHRYLQNVFDYYKIMGTIPITKQLEAKIKKLMNLYEKFKEAEIDDEKWFKCMNELDEDDVIIANIEYRLGFEMKCSNKNIWKYYIEFMGERNSKEMLDIFRRYCRLFISDIEMGEKYRKEIEKSGNLYTEFWYDTITFELDFGDFETAHLLFQKWVITVTGKPYTRIQKESQKMFLERLENFKIEVDIANKNKCVSDTVEPKIKVDRKRKAIDYEKIVRPKPGCSNEEICRFVFKMKGKEYKSPKECHPKLVKYYEPKNALSQNFIFKTPIMQYI
uniref:Uncharacterized protein n=1 Tax=Panagrolaimus sp. ES5 TaxID=591445 RepID=A0AC34G617_9BILA